jgi:hypothetical protein
MYYKDYDPTIHDIYLYGAGNIGYPIGLNPNSLIYGASADFASVIPRYRAFTGTGPIPIPPEAGITSLPNYYNIKDNPLYIVIGDKTISGNIHYSPNKSSDSFGAFGIDPTAKYTGTTTAYPALSLTLWNNTLSGFCSYGPYTGMYNCVPLNQITGSTAYNKPKYFLGSPEIPGFAAGSTQYQILTDDYGIMDLMGVGPTMSQPIAKKISPSVLIQDMKDQGMTFEYNRIGLNQNQISVACTNVYLWDGNDKIIPLQKLIAGYSFLNNPYIISPNTISGIFSRYIDGVTAAAVWTGDSSSQILYMKNNSLYFVASIASGGAGIVDVFGGNVAFVSGPCYVTDALPLYGNLENRLIDKNHYYYPLNQGLTLATQIDFTYLQNALNNLNASANSLYQKWIN